MIFDALKPLIGALILNDTVGRIVASAFRNRIPHRGLSIDTSAAIVTPRIKAMLFFGGYESSEYRFVKQYLPRDLDVIELGGSLGVISCSIRRHINPARRQVVVEADPRLAAALQRNLELNQCDHNIVVDQVAIAYGGDKTVRFAQGETSVAGRLADDTSGSASIDVEAVTLSELLDRHGFGRFALVSDIEGVEWSILHNDRETLARADTIIMETHDNAKFGNYLQLIAQLRQLDGMKLVAQHGPVVVLQRVAGQRE